MTKKKEYGEIDIILQSHAMVMEEVNEIAAMLLEKYEGGMAEIVAKQAAKDYYIFGVLSMKLNPDLRKKAESEVKKYYTERAKRLAPKEVNA